MTLSHVPDVLFHTRVRNESFGGPNPFEWKSVTSPELFAVKRIVLFALLGAFTPSSSDSHLPGQERRNKDLRQDLRRLGVDDGVCVAVNDTFVIFQWANSRGIEKLRMLPDGNADVTRRMGMLVDRSMHEMAMRSWRYAVLVDDGAIEKLFAEPDVRDNPDGSRVTVSDAETMIAWFQGATPQLEGVRLYMAPERSGCAWATSSQRQRILCWLQTRSAWANWRFS